MRCVFFTSSDLDRQSRILPAVAIGLASLLYLAAAQPATAQFQDVGYTFEPTVQGVFQDDEAAFQSGPLYGGALGLSFGRYFQASGEYVVNTAMTSNFSNVGRLQGLIDREVEVRRYGPRLRFNLYDRTVIPYLTVGTGVLAFDPEQAEMSRTIYGLAGGGITFTAYDRYRVSLGGEVMSYRYDPVATFLGPTGAQNFETGTTFVSSPALTASLSLFLGGRSLEEQTAVDQALQEQFGGGGFLRGVGLSVNPFEGRVEFNDALGFPKDQNMAGLNAGVSLGPFVGLRGFYWRGREGAAVTDNVGGGFEDIQMYGGELKLRLNLGLGQGFVPYAKVGGGYLDVLGGYESDIPESSAPPEDRFMGITGAGLEVPLTRGVKLSGGARALLMNNPNQVEAGDPGDIYGSLMYTAGIEFRLGGGADRPTPAPQPEPVLAETGEAEPEAETEETEAGVEERSENDRLRARADSLEMVLAALQGDTTEAEAPARPGERSQAEPGPGQVDTSVPGASSPADPRGRSGRTMVVPVPEEGEIYVRFGKGDGPTTQESSPPRAAEAVQEEPVAQDMEERVRKALRQQLREQGRADSAQAATEIDLERLIQRTVREAISVRQERANRRTQAERQARRQAESEQIQRLQNQIDNLQRQLREQESETPQESVTAESGDSSPFYRQALGRPLTYLVPIAGFRAGKGPEQLHVGIRGDYRSSRSSRFHVVPELSFGLGGGEISPTLLVSGAYDFLRDATTDVTGLPLEPYVGLGGGISSLGGFAFEPVITSMIGLNYRFGGGRRVFLEYSAHDRLSTSRLHVGVRIGL